MKIYTPVKDFNGFRNNVRFVNGVGETDNLETIKWFESHGYTVEQSVEKVITSVETSVEKCDEASQKSLEKCDETKSLRVERAATAQLNEVVGDVGTVNQPDFESMTPNELREWMKENGYGLKMKNIRSKDKLIEIIRG